MGANVVGISADSRDESRELAGRLELPFPLLSDPQRQVIASYGVADRNSEIAVPAVFVISREKQILWRYIGENPPDIPTLDQVVAVLEQNQ